MENPNDITAGMTPDMAAEPALTIGKIFANKVLLKAIVTALIALAAKLWNLNTGDDTVDVWTDAVFYIGIIAAPVVAQFEARKRSLDQGAVTREAVYSPATVQAIADEQYVAGTPPVEPQPEIPAPAQDLGNPGPHYKAFDLG